VRLSKEYINFQRYILNNMSMAEETEKLNVSETENKDDIEVLDEGDPKEGKNIF